MTEPHLFIDPQPNAEVAPLDWDPHPGFGIVEVFYDDTRVLRYMEDGIWAVEDFEGWALMFPNHRWWFDIAGPFRGATYERQGPGRWVLIAERDGFS